MKEEAKVAYANFIKNVDPEKPITETIEDIEKLMKKYTITNDGITEDENDTQIPFIPLENVKGIGELY